MRRLALILLLLVGISVGSASHAAPAASTSRILYSSDWSGTGHIYAVVPARPRDTAQLTLGPAPACAPGSPCGFGSPMPSADGRRLLLADNRKQGPLVYHVYVARADGRARHRIATVERSYPLPPAAWGPDSQRIAYAGADGVHVVRADGSGDRLVSRSAADDRAPAWAPDGTRISFLWRSKFLYLAVADLEPTGPRRGYVLHGSSPYAWTPDGQGIVYTLQQEGVQSLVLLVLTGRERRLLRPVSRGSVRGGVGAGVLPGREPARVRGRARVPRPARDLPRASGHVPLAAARLQRLPDPRHGR